MKPANVKFFVLCCSMAFVLLMGGCGPDSQTKEVIDKIDAIGEVTLESESAIEDARYSYDTLEENQKELVTNLETLEAAEREYAAESVENAINSLPEATLENASTIESVSADYDSLDADTKKLVTNYDVLDQSISQINALKAEEEARAKVLNVGDTIVDGDWDVTLERAQLTTTVEPMDASGSTVTYLDAGNGTTLVDLVFTIESKRNDTGRIIGNALSDIVVDYGGLKYDKPQVDFYSNGLWIPASNYGLGARMPEKVYVVFSIPGSALSDSEPISVDLMVVDREKTITIR